MWEIPAKCWRSGDKAAANEAHQKILQRASVDPIFRLKALSRLELLEYNSRWLAPFAGATGLTIAICGVKVPALGSWDPDRTEKGLGGSEEAVVHASRVLAEMGHRVSVFMEPPVRSLWRLPSSNPRYENIETLVTNSNLKFDLCIAWRNVNFPLLKGHSNNVYFWPHDLMQGGYPCADLKGSFFLSEYHRRRLVGACSELNNAPYVISGNGVDMSQFPRDEQVTNKERPLSLVYASNYSRGLGLLLSVWRDVRRDFPEATLDIYYGRETWGTMSAEALASLVKHIEVLASEGVTEKGQVGHAQLAAAFRGASVLGYPCITDSETFCITAVKAQLAGMIPVVVRAGALEETVHPKAPSVDWDPAATDLPQRYLKVLKATLSRISQDRGEIAAERQTYHDFASKYTWQACVNKWLELYEKTK
jgi:glycosyltransferase involved in cell wall biosynthesis